jgi:1-acyl-sn-glycerol-3-phosphate acyltransferase
MRKILYYLYQPYKWLFFVPAFFIFTFIFGIFALIFSIIAGSRVAGLLFGVYWAKFIAYLTPISVKVTGSENVKPRQSYIVVTNHQSAFDILVIYGWLGIDIKWVMKRELRYIPGLGFGSRMVGHIFIDRSSVRSSMKSIEHAKKRIKKGTSLVFFPEGSRSLTGEVGSFKKGAFKTAFDLDLPILPVTINGTRNILPSRSWDILPGKATITIHPPIDLNSHTYENVDKLMEITRQSIISGLEDNATARKIREKRWGI